MWTHQNTKTLNAYLMQISNLLQVQATTGFEQNYFSGFNHHHPGIVRENNLNG
jgi:hypothetical protein